MKTLLIITAIAWTLVLLMVLTMGCTTTKYVDRVEYKYDSSAINERDSILHVKKEDSVYYKNIIESMGENTIIFQDTGSVRIEYRPDGSIDFVEGKLKSANNKVSKSQLEIGYWKEKYDSMAQVKNRVEVQTKTVYKTKTVEKESRFTSWWLFLITFIAGCIFWEKAGKRIKPFFKTKLPI